VQKLTIEDIELAGQTVLMRVDFNVPLNASGQITDNLRITAALPSINYVLQHGAKLVLMSHLGRPKGKPDPKLSLAPAAAELSRLLTKDVKFLSDCVGGDVKAAVAAMQPGEVVMLENLRFHPEEKASDPVFAKELADLGTVFVNDAFAVSHRADASVAGVTDYLTSAAGFLLTKEIENIATLLEDPPKPFVAILGGAKVSDKLAVIKNLAAKAQAILIGGAMAYTFLKALGEPIGRSLCEEELVATARDIIEKCGETGVDLMLPVDHVAVASLEPGAKIQRDVPSIPDNWYGVDIGSETVSRYREQIAKAATVFWNGPMGIFEVDAYAKGTEQIARALAESNCRSVIGGGDSAAAVKKMGVADKMTHISTGGGASLELVEGKDLPGIVALTDKA